MEAAQPALIGHATMLSTRWTARQEAELLRRADAGEPLIRIARSLGRTQLAAKTKLALPRKRAPD